MDSPLTKNINNWGARIDIILNFFQVPVQISCDDILLSLIGSSQDNGTLLSQDLSAKGF